MASAWCEGAEDRIGKVITEEIDEATSMLTGWVLVATFYDDQGDLCVAFNSMEEQRRTATLGMLNHVLEIERAAIFWSEKPED